ncbi:MAG: hypothetical protein D6798_08015 [Deltaproteobacteria bacterium]|nr:MAG: hypothetical protein D6798_08015 [Deltaproteobacteria bacterium]
MTRTRPPDPHEVENMASQIRTGTLLALLFAAGCTGKDQSPFGSSGGSSTDPPTTTDTGDTGGGDSGGDGGGGGGDGGGDGGSPGAGFDNPGDVVPFSDSDGLASVDLVDESGDSNQDQEFYLVMLRTLDSALGYQLRYDSAGAGSDKSLDRSARDSASPRPLLSRDDRLTPERRALRQAIRSGVLGPATPPPPAPYDATDIGTAQREFRVRNSLVDETSYSASSATLWAIGETVAIWVDDTVPIDWDIDCDGVVDVADPYDAYGFDNCDLQTIADIVDANIIPNTRAVFGDESDVNGDGLVSVVITPELNVISFTSDDESVQGALVGSYADPEVDLNSWDAETNPVSDEQEVIYVFAPDPYGFYNPYATATVDEYTSMELAAQIARSFFALVSYNQHVLVAGGEVEEGWVNQAFGALAADLTGFGAVYFDDAWDYLDAPHLQPLVTSSDAGTLSTDSVGAQYLFARWLYDAFGAKTLASIVQVPAADTGSDVATTGTENIANVIGAEFSDIALSWQIALLTTGVTDADGAPLINSKEYALYADAVTLSAPTSDPSPGDYYGANGYQSGIDIRGTNRYMEGGTTDRPVENVNNRVTTSGPDHFTYVTGNEFWGYLDGEYAAQVVRLTNITFDEAQLKIQAAGTGFVGAIVRWNDPDPLTPDLTVERIFSPTSVDNIELPLLPADGGRIYGVGQISEPGFTTLVLDDGTTQKAPVADTDRWLLSLDDFPVGTDVTVAVHLTRQYADDSGDPGPFDPWIAVVPTSLVPTPTVEGTNRGACTEGLDFQYPTSMLEYLYYQLFTSSDDGSATWVEPTLEEPFSCGTITGDTTCGEDWDRDGILDVDELQPQNFIEQVHAMQCTIYGNDTSLFELVLPEEIIDFDTIDEDEISYYDRARNLGGMSDDSGEEAYMEVTLTGGQDYLVMVGAYDYQGTYELEVVAVD